MSLFALVPVKELGQAKSRLSEVPTDRPTLVLHLLRHVLGVLTQVEEISQIWLVSPDPALGPVAAEWDAHWLEQTSRGLNPGLEEARRALPESCDVLVILPDLPYLQLNDMHEFIKVSQAGLTLAPDRAGTGTNLWLSRPGRGLPFRFGEGSCAAHPQAAREAGWPVALFRSPGSERDLDSADDWKEYQWSLRSSSSR